MKSSRIYILSLLGIFAFFGYQLKQFSWSELKYWSIENSASTQTRVIAKFAPTKLNLLEFMQRLKNSLQEKNLNCIQNLEPLYLELAGTLAEQVDYSHISNEIPETTELAFENRLLIRKYLEEQEKQNKLDLDCLENGRGLLRGLRFVEEYLSAWTHIKPKVRTSAQAPAPYVFQVPFLGGTKPFLRINPDYQKEFKDDQDLRSGDLIASKGKANTSALIARMGDIDGQFSHVAMIYKDPATRKTYAMEMHIEVGSTVRPYEIYAKDRNFRALVFRLKNDPNHLAAKAAEYMFRKLKPLADKGENWPYDFKMKIDDKAELYCSELAREAYAVASGGKMIIPSHITRLNPKIPYVLNKLGIKDRILFAPSDLEVDFRFDVVAEWKDIPKVFDNHKQDAIASSILNWFDQGYVVKNSYTTRIKSNAAIGMRSMGMIKDKVAPNIDKESLKFMMQFEETAGVVLKELNSRFVQYWKSRGHPMSYADMMNEIESIRSSDAEKQKTQGSSVFHEILVAPRQR